MLQLKTKIGQRGQLVIPKIVRESLGLTENKVVVLHVEQKSLRLIPLSGEEIISSWNEIAKTQGVNVTKELIYGDKLYEEVF